MICKKCKKEMYPNKDVCPHCGNLVVKKYKNTNSGVKNKYIKSDSLDLIGSTVTKNSSVKLQKKKQVKKKTSKNKYIKEDKTNLTGGMVSEKNKSFIRVEKKNKNQNTINTVNRKDYINYIDYKTARDEQELRINNFNEKLKFLKKESENEIPKIGTRVTEKPDNKFVKNNLNKMISVSKQPVTYNNVTNNESIVNGKFFQNIANSNTRNDVIIDVPQNKKRSFKKETSIFKYAIIIGIWIIAIIALINVTDNDFYFSENNNIIRTSVSGNDDDLVGYEGVSKSGQDGGSSSVGVTSIVYDNQYLNLFTLKNSDSAYDLIKVDSTKQKGNCPTNIVAIENEIIQNYDITAVNLCEMDEDFALEIKNVIKYIYDNFPTARNYLTNLTLANVGESSTFIAAFMPIFTFSTSNSNSGYPVSTKTQILLNAKYFLDNSKIKNSVSYGARSGYFPKNATRSSTVAHEFGHYLSYVALLNYYGSKQLNFVKATQSSLLYEVYDDFNAGNFSKMLLQEAYNKYVKNTGSTESFYEFRESISTYAVAKDSNGSYIYDETIAEAFHDYYLNGNNAAPASLTIVEVLKSKL